jgi:hypothetical protein
MAKVKLGKFPKRWYFRLLIKREEEDVKLFHKKCDDFHSFLKEKLPFKKHSFVLGKQLVDEDNYSFDVHFWPEQEAKVKAVILEGAEKYKIEFEEEKEKKEEKWIPVHGIIEEIITRNSKLHVRTIATLYAMGGKIPPKAAGKLIEDLENASLSIIMDANLRTLVDRAIKNLKQQQEEG